MQKRLRRTIGAAAALSVPAAVAFGGVASASTQAAPQSGNTNHSNCSCDQGGGGHGSWGNQGGGGYGSWGNQGGGYGNGGAQYYGRHAQGPNYGRHAQGPRNYGDGNGNGLAGVGAGGSSGNHHGPGNFGNGNGNGLLGIGIL
jgi:hypothetical protein